MLAYCVIATSDTPLLMAVRGHQDLVVIQLLKQGVDVNQVNAKVRK